MLREAPLSKFRIPPKRSDQKRELYKLIIARSDITAALNVCDLFLKEVKGLDHPLYYPLFCSIVICYARPFTDNRPLGRLPKKWTIFPNARAQWTHNKLISTRNELMAHSDFNIRGVQIIPAGVKHRKINFISKGIGVTVKTFYFPLERFRNIRANCLYLGSKLHVAIEEQIEILFGNMDLPNAPFDIRLNEGL